jgi:E3 ubiquitin-protein ligase HECTD2
MPSLGLGKLLSSSATKNNYSQDAVVRRPRPRASSDKDSRNRSRSPLSTPLGGDRSISDNYYSPARRRTPRPDSDFETDDYGFPVSGVSFDEFQIDVERPIQNNRPTVKGRCRTCNKAYQATQSTVWKCDVCFTSNGTSSGSSRSDFQRDPRPLSVTKTADAVESAVEDILRKADERRYSQRNIVGKDSTFAGEGDELVPPTVPTSRRGSAPSSSRPDASAGFATGSIRHSMQRRPPGKLEFDATLRPRMPSSPNLTPSMPPGKNSVPTNEPLNPVWGHGVDQSKLEDTMHRHSRMRRSIAVLNDHLAEALKRQNLNVSFSTVSRHRKARSNEVNRWSKQAQDTTTSSLGHKIYTMDHKNLMVGDVYDVASSLISEQSSSAKRIDPDESHLPKLVDFGSPHIEWRYVQKWYQVVLESVKPREPKGSGETLTLTEPKDPEMDSTSSLDALSQNIRSTVLDLQEQLMISPQKQPSEPRDIRYLLIMLANPIFTNPKDFPVRQRSRRTRSVTIPGQDHPSSSRKKSPQRIIQRYFLNPKQSRVLSLILGTISNLPGDCHKYLVQWFSRYPEDLFRKHVNMLLGFLAERLSTSLANGINRSSKTKTYNGVPMSHMFKEYLQTDLLPDEPQFDWQLRAVCKTLQLFVRANDIYHTKTVSKHHGNYTASTRRRAATKQLIPTSYFYSHQLDEDKFHAKRDFDDWEKKRPGLQLVQYSFLLSLARKIEILEFDANRKMEAKVRQEFFDSISRYGNIDKYFHLKVRRSCIVEDSLQRVSEAINASEEEAKKALKVHFEGEEGIDAGGLRKEWFLLLIKELFDPDVGKCCGY